VDRARLVQRERFARRPGIYANAHMAPRDTRAFCRVSEGADALLRAAITRLGLSARGYHRVLKIARTVADLDGAGELQPKHVSEAIQYRSLDRRASVSEVASTAWRQRRPHIVAGRCGLFSNAVPPSWMRCPIDTGQQRMRVRRCHPTAGRVGALRRTASWTPSPNKRSTA
jgi:hypothetical protein